MGKSKPITKLFRPFAKPQADVKASSCSPEALVSLFRDVDNKAKGILRLYHDPSSIGQNTGRIDVKDWCRKILPSYHSDMSRFHDALWYKARDRRRDGASECSVYGSTLADNSYGRLSRSMSKEGEHASGESAERDSRDDMEAESRSTINWEDIDTHLSVMQERLDAWYLTLTDLGIIDRSDPVEEYYSMDRRLPSCWYENDLP